MDLQPVEETMDDSERNNVAANNELESPDEYSDPSLYGATMTMAE